MINLLRKAVTKSFSCKPFSAIGANCLKKTFCNVAAEEKINISVTPSYVKLPPQTIGIQKQKFDYFLVLDFEATCDSPKTVIPQEIIEFPVLKVNGKTFEIESIFHSYVRPTVNPQLTEFCTDLTGITQDMLRGELTFDEVFEDFKIWLEQENLNQDVNFAWVSCGDWDLKFLFPVQCKGLRIQVPYYMKKWINIKLIFADAAQTWPRNLVTMIKFCELQHEGKLHSGIDDCKNIAKVLKNLAERGIVFEHNGQTH